MSKKRRVDEAETSEEVEEQSVEEKAEATDISKEQPVLPAVEGKQKCTIQEFGIMKGIMKNWYSAFSLYCKRNKLLIPKPFNEWDSLFNKFKKM